MHDTHLESLVHPILSDHGLELEDLDVTPVGRRKIVRVTVDGDGPCGTGPLLDDITAASRAISHALDDAGFGSSFAYTLEVSSRGVSKPLSVPKHYRRNAGRLLKVWTGAGEVTGRVVEADDESVTLDIEGTIRHFAFAEIRKAVVQIELNRPAPGLDDEEN